MRKLFSFLIVFFPLIIMGCAAKEIAREKTPGEEKISWYALISRAQMAEYEPSPFRVSASLRYKDPVKDESIRVSALLWGNGQEESPLRLDLSAGLGSIVAKIVENHQGFLAYNTDEETAYFRPGKGTKIESFGVPIPLSMKDLSLILTGRSGQLFLPKDAEADKSPSFISVSAGGIIFPAPSAPLPGFIEVARNGNLLSWREANPGGWMMEFTPSEDPLIPRRIKITHGQGYEAIISVSELSKVDSGFTKAQLSLSLPTGTKMKNL